MITFYPASAAKPSVAKNHLLFAVLDLNGIKYQVTRDPDLVAASDMVVTDCFVMETPCYDDQSDHDLCKTLIEMCAEHNKPLVFYYPSESRSTLDASFNPTGEYLQQQNARGYLIKNGSGTTPGFTKSYDIHEYFAWQITTEFNLARLSQTQQRIETQPKQKSFLYLNGEARPHRKFLFDVVATAGLLSYGLWSNHRSKEYQQTTRISPDWHDIEIHRDFKFDAYFADHYVSTEFSLISETTPSEFFPTEKTFKPILLGHPFLVVSNRYFLRDLRAMGFKTFGNIINETYDEQLWYEERAQAAVDEVTRLIHMPGLIELTKSIREHNRLHIYHVANQAYQHLLDVLTDIAPITMDQTLPELTSDIFESYIRT